MIAFADAFLYGMKVTGLLLIGVGIGEFFYPWLYCWIDDLLAARAEKKELMELKKKARANEAKAYARN